LRQDIAHTVGLDVAGTTLIAEALVSRLEFWADGGYSAGHVNWIGFTIFSKFARTKLCGKDFVFPIEVLTKHIYL
jgi:hypothetical protein